MTPGGRRRALTGDRSIEVSGRVTRPEPPSIGPTGLGAGAPPSRRSRTVTPVIDWMFRNRRTGGLTVAQLPNASLAAFLALTALRLVASPYGYFRTALDVVGRAALIWWAGDELMRGVNPFRQMLGAAILAAMVIGFVR